jgi:hypothetical protein
LDVWKKAKSNAGNQLFADFASLIQHRHWLAHGRYWTDKSGVSPDPGSSRIVVDALFNALQGVAADFPLA